MYTKAEINKKYLEALARKEKNLANKALQNKANSVPSNSVLTSKSFSINNTSHSVNSHIKNANFPVPFKRDDTKKIISKNHTQGNRFNPLGTKNFYGVNNKVSVKTYMISPNRFTVECSAFNTQFNNILKTINNRFWDHKSKTWNFLLKDYEEVVKKLADDKSFTVSGIPFNVLKIFRRTVDKNLDNIDLSEIDPILTSMAKPFQIEGIKYGILKSGRVMIADDMGLGKTIQALGIAHYYKEKWPLLIVTPSSIRYQWTEAIYKYLPSVPAQVIQQIRTTKDFIGSELITIISYDLLSRMVNEIEKKFNVIIIDESHFLKSHKSMRTQAVSKVSLIASHIILLSGTPALSRPVELYTQVALLKKDFMPFHEYGKRYCAGELTKFGWNYNGYSNMQELQELLKLIFFIRRMKSEVLTQLPEKLRQVIILDPQQIKSATREMKQALKSLESTSVNKKDKHSILLQYYSDTAGVKVQAVCKYITDLMEGERKFIVFAHHKIMLNAVCELLHSKKKRFIRIDGETSSELRSEYVNKFQNDDSIIVAVLSITAANAGLNLTAACLVVFAELSWNPGILNQAEDRVYRIGQSNNVVIQYLIAKDTADDYLWNLLQKKMEVLQEAGLRQDFSVKDMNVTDQKQNKNQPLMDSFLHPSTSTPPDKIPSFEEMLNDEDDGFGDIDLDNIAS